MERDFSELDRERFEKAASEERARLNGADYVPPTEDEMRARATRSWDARNRAADESRERIEASNRYEVAISSAGLIGVVAAVIAGFGSDNGLAGVIAFLVVSSLTFSVIKGMD